MYEIDVYCMYEMELMYVWSWCILYVWNETNVWNWYILYVWNGTNVCMKLMYIWICNIYPQLVCLSTGCSWFDTASCCKSSAPSRRLCDWHYTLQTWFLQKGHGKPAKQLLQPSLIMATWMPAICCGRRNRVHPTGRFVEIVNENGLIWLNDGSGTHIFGTSIDLSLIDFIIKSTRVFMGGITHSTW